MCKDGKVAMIPREEILQDLKLLLDAVAKDFKSELTPLLRLWYKLSEKYEEEI